LFGGGVHLESFVTPCIADMYTPFESQVHFGPNTVDDTPFESQVHFGPNTVGGDAAILASSFAGLCLPSVVGVYGSHWCYKKLVRSKLLDWIQSPGDLAGGRNHSVSRYTAGHPSFFVEGGLGSREGQQLKRQNIATTNTLTAERFFARALLFRSVCASARL
jgi:hypothetical protein